ncbi:MAG: hypothetical protein J6A52_07005 [Bacilli bacterium]|nr:hypothetical protein [Bacilli bacterium]
MGNVNQEWLDSLNLVNELGKKLEPSFVNDSWNIIYGTIKQRFGDSFKSGLVIDSDEVLKKMDEYVSRNDVVLSQSSQYMEYKKALLEANFQTRKKTFIDYVQMDEEGLNSDKSETLAAYNELLSTLKSYPSDRMGPDYSTITIDMMVGTEGKAEIRSDRRVPFDNAYDVIRTYCANTIHSSEKVLGKTHNSYIEYLQSVIDKLNGMTPQDYKNYKIDLLRLTDEEVKRINNEFSYDLESTTDKSVSDVVENENVVPSVNVEDVANIHQENTLEVVKEEVPTFASSLIGKMENYPSQFKTSIIDCLTNICEFDVTSPTNFVTVAFDRVDEIAPGVKILSGKMQVFDSNLGVSRAVDYHLSSGEESKMYNCTMNLDNSRYSFQYNDAYPERGVNMQVHKHRAVNVEPRFGIAGVEYEGTILPDGNISARGITTEVPSMYDESGTVRKVSKFKTGDFTSLSYQELENITNSALKLDKTDSHTLS